MNCGTPLRAGKDPSTDETQIPGAEAVEKERAARTLPAADREAGFLDRYLPRELVSKLEAARKRGAMAGERRVITMLFCDVKGSTAAAEQLDPEAWTEIMNGAFERMIQPIYKYEGTVPRLMGDAILAFFGAPIAHEDDPQRAVWAGLEIQAAMKPYAEQVRREHGFEFGLRAGINTGLVVVGEIGSDLRMEYTALGDAINLAARMEQTARPGTVQITEETHKLIAPLFDFAELGGIEVKGKAQPVVAYRVLGRKAEPGPLRGLEGLSSPLIGREAPMRLLRDRLEGLEAGCRADSWRWWARRGWASLRWWRRWRGSVAVSEIREREPPGCEGKGWRTPGRSATSYGGRSSGGRSGRARRMDPRKCARSCGRHVRRRGWRRETSHSWRRCWQSRGRRAGRPWRQPRAKHWSRGSTEATRAYLTSLAQAGPLVLVFDDLHWADEASLALLSKASELVNEQPIVFVCMLRPDKEAPSWRAMQGVQVRLGTRYAVDHAGAAGERADRGPAGEPARDAGVPAGIARADRRAGGRQPVLRRGADPVTDRDETDRARGRALARAGRGRVRLPDTLRGVLGARIDRLPEPERHTLQMAAVIGRTFDRRVLERLAGAEGLERRIARLQEAGLMAEQREMPQRQTVHEAEAHPGTQGGTATQEDSARNDIAFRHVMIQEAAYESILIKRRGELHRQVGESLEELHAGRIEELAPVLAHHFFEAHDDRCLKYDLLAGDKAAGLYANAEAAMHYRRALETARRTGLDAAQMADIHSKLGGVLELMGRYAEALQTYEEMQAFGHEHQAPVDGTPSTDGKGDAVLDANRVARPGTGGEDDDPGARTLGRGRRPEHANAPELEPDAELPARGAVGPGV